MIPSFFTKKKSFYKKRSRNLDEFKPNENFGDDEEE